MQYCLQGCGVHHEMLKVSEYYVLEPRVMHQDAFWLICALMSDDLNGGV